MTAETVHNVKETFERTLAEHDFLRKMRDRLLLEGRWRSVRGVGGRYAHALDSVLTETARTPSARARSSQPRVLITPDWSASLDSAGQTIAGAARTTLPLNCARTVRLSRTRRLACLRFWWPCCSAWR